MHLLDEDIKSVSTSSKIIETIRGIGFRSPILLQSMIIYKQPRIGGRVTPHQDSTFLYTDPPSAVGFWFALDDCTVDNGTLAFIPGSHKSIIYFQVGA